MNKDQMGKQIHYLDAALKECEAENERLVAALATLQSHRDAAAFAGDKAMTRNSALEADLARCRAANVYDAEAHRKVSALEELIIQHNVRAINEQHPDWVIPIDTKQIAFTAETSCVDLTKGNV